MTEEELFNTKWWDYRPLTPTEATLEFIKEYAEALNWHNEMVAGIPSLGSHILKKINNESPERWEQWNTMTKIRWFADINYMPYSFFWFTAFSAIIELKYRKTFLNVFLNERLQSWVLQRYEMKCKEEKEAGHISHARNPFFKPKNYTGHPLQDAYYEHLISLYMEKYGNRAEKAIEEIILNRAISDEYLKKKAEIS